MCVKRGKGYKFKTDTFQSNSNRSILHTQVQEATPFKYPDITEGYMFVANNCLYFLQLVKQKKTKVRKIKLGDVRELIDVTKFSIGLLIINE